MSKISLVADANVFQAFYEEEVLGHVGPRPERSASAKPVLGAIQAVAFAFVDTSGKIEKEWRDRCQGNNEWFDAWFGGHLQGDRIRLLDCKNSSHLSKRYRQLGCPNDDVVYIKVAVESTKTSPICSLRLLVTEDIDFYDPKQKRAKDKLNSVFLPRKGIVVKALDADGVHVCCLAHVHAHLSAL